MYYQTIVFYLRIEILRRRTGLLETGHAFHFGVNVRVQTGEQTCVYRERNRMEESALKKQ